MSEHHPCAPRSKSFKQTDVHIELINDSAGNELQLLRTRAAAIQVMKDDNVGVQVGQHSVSIHKV
jgi:hypothetical protein